MIIKLQQFMTKKDWAYLVILLVISAVIWVWVWREYQKPIIDPSWYTKTVSRVDTPRRGSPTAFVSSSFVVEN